MRIERVDRHLPLAKAIVALLAALALAVLAFGLSAQAYAEEASAAGDAAQAAADNPDQLAGVSGYPTEGRFVDGIASLPDFYEHADKNAANAEENAPARFTDRNGFTVQRTPEDAEAYNNTYLDADNRGCNSCHTLENALMSLPTYHRLIFFGYNTEQTYENCVACHSDSYSGRSLADPIHTIHMNSVSSPTPTAAPASRATTSTRPLTPSSCGTRSSTTCSRASSTSTPTRRTSRSPTTRPRSPRPRTATTRPSSTSRAPGSPMTPRSISRSSTTGSSPSTATAPTPSR